MEFSLSKEQRKDMSFSMRLSFLISIFILLIKAYAYYITSSRVILSDAAESLIHVFAVGFAAYSMWLSLKPADETHLYGHDKISFFSAGFEGAMIIIAAIFIIYQAIYAFIYNLEIQNVDGGLLFTSLAVFINGSLGFYLIRKGKKHKSLILDANGKHTLTDCWTSLGAIIALILVKLTGVALFDPMIAIVTALNILWMGSKLVRESVRGLMDRADPLLHRQIINCLKIETEKRGLEFHHLRHRVSGNKIFIEFHLLFPANTSLYEAHDTATTIEAYIKKSINIPMEVFSHLEPQDGHDKIHQEHGFLI